MKEKKKKTRKNRREKKKIKINRGKTARKEKYRK